VRRGAEPECRQCQNQSEGRDPHGTPRRQRRQAPAAHRNPHTIHAAKSVATEGIARRARRRSPYAPPYCWR
jgi:hypothetical protein